MRERDVAATLEEHVLVGGLSFPEEPRWRDGRLWFIDVGAELILAVDEAGREAGRVTLDFAPGGLGWLPDGTLLVVDVTGCRVVAVSRDLRTQSTYTDLGPLVRLRPNGLCVSRDGVAYVASIGSELQTEGPRPSGNIIVIEPDLSQRVLFEDDIRFPNGVALSRDERRLYVPETFGERVSIFDLADGRRTIAEAPGMWPDGSCHADGDSLWFADAGSPRVVRVDHAGRTLETLTFSRRCFAPALNGRGDRLYVAVADDHGPEARRRGTGAIVWRSLPSTP